MVMGTKETLGAARSRIDTPEKWWPGKGSAKDDATCAVLALDDVTGNVLSPAHEALGRAIGYGGPDPWLAVKRFNDRSTHAEVLAAFDRAIASA